MSRSRPIVVLALVPGLVVFVGLSVAMPSRAGATVASGALSQLPSPSNCVSDETTGDLSCGTLIPSGLEESWESVVSPDARNVYAIGSPSSGEGTLIEFSRNQATGALSEIGCITKSATSCSAVEATTGVSNMEELRAIAISPDGNNVYITAGGSKSAVLAFDRNPVTGLLSEAGCVSHGAGTGCATEGAPGLEDPKDVVVSPDGENVYVTSEGEQAVVELSRNTETGTLTQLGGSNDCITTKATGCGTTEAPGLEEANSVTVSPDGENVYVSSSGAFFNSGGDIAEFERETSKEGALKQLAAPNACLTSVGSKAMGFEVEHCTLTGEHVNGPRGLQVSPDGENVYADAVEESAVLEFSRNTSEHGALERVASPNECVSSRVPTPTGCTQAKSIEFPTGVAISPDGSNVYVTSGHNKSVAAFEREPGGALKQLPSPYECIAEDNASGCATVNADGLSEAHGLSMSPDGTNVYVSGRTSASLAEFARAVTPTVSEVTPNDGPEAGGTEVTIEGGGFVAGATVSFGGRAARSVTVNSASSIQAVSPAGTGTVNVTVTTYAGTSAISGADEYAYGRLGGLDIAGYCESLDDDGTGSGSTILLRGAIEGPEYAYDNWACVTNNGADVPIAAAGTAPSMNNACAVAFPGVPAHAYAENPNSAYSWNCYEGAPPAENKGGGTEKSGLPSIEKLPSEALSVNPVATTASVPPPALAKTGNVAPVAGQVLVKLPGTNTFVPLSSLKQIPFGTIIEATHGTVSVTSANPNGTTQTGQFFDGQFVLTQGNNGQVLAKLSGGNFSVCPTARERSHIARAGSLDAYEAASSGKHVVRKLWANAHGKFSTQGNYAAGAVQGTEWLTEDLCEGTLIKVTRDKVAVTNLVNHKHVEVTTGHHYLAKAPR